MRYRAVIFDLFGTLVDDLPWQTYLKMLGEMAARLSVSVEPFRKLWMGTYGERTTGVFPTTEANLLHICRSLGVQPDRDQLEAAIEVRLEFVRRWLTPRRGALETLSKLKEAGLKLGLVSDCSPEVPFLWDETPFSRLIDEAVLSCKEGCKKPAPRLYLLVCCRLSVVPEQCLYVGDGNGYELTGAAHVGMHPVLIRGPREDTSGRSKVDALRWDGPTIRAPEEVLHLIFGR